MITIPDYILKSLYKQYEIFVSRWEGKSANNYMSENSE